MSRGDGRVFQRGAQWVIAYYCVKAGEHVEVREPGGLTKQKALQLLKRRRKQVIASDFGGEAFSGPQRLTVDALLNDLVRAYEVHQKELKKSASHMKPLRTFFGGDLAARITSDRLNQYILARRNNQAANSTINRELNILRRAFNLAAKQTPPKFPKSQVPEFPARLDEHVREGFAGKTDTDAILAALHNVDVRDYVEWAFWTGMRRGEIGKLTWADFDRETSTLVLPGRSTKTKKPRKLALEGTFREIMTRRLSARRLDCPLIFHRQGKPMGDFRKAWAHACEQAGVSGLLFHDLRRTAVRNMIRAGVDKKVARAISGHQTEAVFERYDITSDDDLKAAVHKIDAYVSTIPTKSNLTILSNTDRTRTEAG